MVWERKLDNSFVVETALLGFIDRVGFESGEFFHRAGSISSAAKVSAALAKSCLDSTSRRLLKQVVRSFAGPAKGAFYRVNGEISAVFFERKFEQKRGPDPVGFL